MLKKFNIEKPIIQAPMAGATSPRFVAACCEAGVLGSIGAGYLNGEETRDFIREVKKLTDKPFSVNLFIQEEPQIDIGVLQDARMALQPIYEELGIEGVSKVISDEVFSGQVQAVIDEKVPILSFTFGIPEQEVIKRLKDNGVFVIGTATTLEEAIAVERAGLQAVVLQGSEAGGHRGSFTEPLQLVPLRELMGNVVSGVSIPIIAAGGIMTSEHVGEMLNLGAGAVQVGTALLTAEESEVNELHKEAILHSKEKDTTLTKAFTGKYARGLKNTFTEALKDAVVAPYPLQHHLTITIRQKSGKIGKPEYLSLWMGENSYMAKRAPVHILLDELTRNLD
ncbi:NAD(P)H-dependent flavin oxidoreductase [Lysinibacillus sp. 54212]|uniref:NAD(P)H-dependent flavin oxidoreductase n=1 Tax=Lysinibacillus sp. 54212 TaxID=3119829 RepID=UPI002FC6FB68